MIARFHRFTLFALLAVLLAVNGVSAQGPVGYAFTYQGRLTDGGVAPTGPYDLEFKLFDDLSAGGQIGGTLVKDDVAVTNGLFTVQLDFGSSAFPANKRYLYIGVRPGASGGAFTPLAPRQELTPTPYALNALGNWSLAGNAGTNSLVNFLGTTDGSPLVFKTFNLEHMRLTTGGHVGINTNSPKDALDVVWPSTQIRFGASTDDEGGYLISVIPSQGILAGGAKWTGSTWQARATEASLVQNKNGAVEFYTDSGLTVGYDLNPTPRMRIAPDGKVSIGTFSTCYSTRLYVFLGNSGNTCNEGAIVGENSVDPGVVGQSNSDYGVLGRSNTTAGVHGSGTYGVTGAGTSGYGVGGFSYTGTGVEASSIGGANLIEAFDRGPAIADRRFAVVRTTGAVLADGPHTGPADFAEMMQVAGLKEDYQPGEVLVISADGKLSKAANPYATNLAGVYSARPGFLGDTAIAEHGIEAYDSPPTKERLAVALMGIVPVKVSVVNGFIAVGDPLTSSSTPGVAMKATQAGKIVGYALEGTEREGKVLMLVQPGYYLPEVAVATGRDAPDSQHERLAELEKQNAELKQQNTTIQARLTALEQAASGQPQGVPLQGWALWGALLVIGVVLSRRVRL